MNSSSSKVG